LLILSWGRGRELPFIRCERERKEEEDRMQEKKAAFFCDQGGRKKRKVSPWFITMGGKKKRTSRGERGNGLLRRRLFGGDGQGGER